MGHTLIVSVYIMCVYKYYFPFIYEKHTLLFNCKNKIGRNFIKNEFTIPTLLLQLRKKEKNTHTPLKLPLHCQCTHQTTNCVNVPPNLLKKCQCPSKINKNLKITLKEL
jgi:hypothetical protein